MRPRPRSGRLDASVRLGPLEATGGWLSRFGIELVQAMNRVGMLVEFSHSGYCNSMDVFEVSQAPVVFSHSYARAVWNHERNIRDEQAHPLRGPA